MFDSLVTEEEVLADEGINSDACEGKADDEHDDGAKTGETLEGVEHWGEKRRFEMEQ
jgi:hypothetical protein